MQTWLHHWPKRRWMAQCPSLRSLENLSPRVLSTTTWITRRSHSLSTVNKALPLVSEDFDSKALKAAVLDSQLNSQKFRAFCERAIRAGVQGYFAFLRGKRVIYLGRQGDQHVEWFPGSKPGDA